MYHPRGHHFHAMTNDVQSLYLEDIAVGQTFESAPHVLTVEEIKDFAGRYDPQFFHLDDEAARESLFGGLAASGWHTASMMMRVFADSFLSDVSSQGSPGLDELRWYHPVRPGDTLFVRAVVLEARLSKSKPELGVMRTRTEVHNQNHELVLSSTAANFIRRRPAGKT